MISPKVDWDAFGIVLCVLPMGPNKVTVVEKAWVVTFIDVHTSSEFQRLGDNSFVEMVLVW